MNNNKRIFIFLVLIISFIFAYVLNNGILMQLIEVMEDHR